MMRSRRVAALVAAALALTAGACSVPAQRGPGSGPTALSLTGRLLQVDGQAPAAGVPVVLTSDPNAGETAFGVLAFGFSLGLSCLGPQPLAPCSRSSRTTSDVAGKFAFDLDKGGLAKVSGGASGLVFTAGGHQEGPAVTVRFRPASKVEVPDLAFWDARLTLAPGSAHQDVAEFRWAGPPAAGRPGSTLRFTDDRGATVATIDGAGPNPAAQLDLRALEDLSGPAILTASTAVRASSVDLTMSWLASPVRYPVLGPKPLSRGAPCAIDGRMTSPCPLTDGDLTTGLPLGGGGCPPEVILPPDAQQQTVPPCQPPSGAIVIDLGSTRELGLLVTHGQGPLSIDTSTDGQSWHAARSTSSGASLGGASAYAPSGSSVRYIRVGRTGGVPALVAEVSAWPPQPAIPAAEPPTSVSGVAPVAHPASSQAHRRHRTGRRYLLAGFGLLALVAVAFVTGRLRRPMAKAP